MFNYIRKNSRAIITAYCLVALFIYLAEKEYYMAIVAIPVCLYNLWAFSREE